MACHASSDRLFISIVSLEVHDMPYTKTFRDSVLTSVCHLEMNDLSHMETFSDSVYTSGWVPLGSEWIVFCILTCSDRTFIHVENKFSCDGICMEDANIKNFGDSTFVDVAAAIGPFQML